MYSSGIFSMKSFFSGLFDSNEKQLKKIQPIIDQINSLEDYYKDLKDSELADKTREFKEALGGTSNTSTFTGKLERDNRERVKKELFKILPDAFALVRESARRFTNHRHFDVQLVAGYFLADNKITELFTGEGKTNAATLAMYLYALTGRGAHLVTVNDYLARRDGEWNGHVLAPLGITVGVINNNIQYRYVSDEEAMALKGSEAKEEIEARNAGATKAGRLKLDLMSGVNLVECSKQDVYKCNVVYGTNNEFGFDYLRDNMARQIEDRVQGQLHYAIVDEADSILIDEARTPLIISQSAQDSNEMYSQFAKIVRSLNIEEHYVVDEKEQSVSISDNGIDLVEKKLGIDNVYEDAELAYHLDNALKAKELYRRDDQYIVRNGEIVIVDEFTGRAMEGRRYSEGLHQAIEAKEGVEVKQESKTLATITLQNYFRLYDFLAGMTATALTEAEEFSNIYKLDVVVIPTNQPVVRVDENDVVYRTEIGKFKSIINDIKSCNEKGQPVLVGTASVEKSEILSNMLEKEGIKHNVLNAKQHEREAHIVRDAGLKGQVTIATNMAGRGTDIALGEGVIELGGLYVIGSERHESRRIDNQLRGRSGRQGDPGKSRFYVSFEDDLMKRFGGDRSVAILQKVGMEDDMPISLGVLGRIIENAQKKVESHNFDIRKRLVEYDDVLNQQREIVYGLRRDILKIISENSETTSEQETIDISSKSLQEVNLNILLEGLERFSIKSRESWIVSGFGKFETVNLPLNNWILKRVIDQVRGIIAAQLSDDMKIDNLEERKVFSQINSLLTEDLFEAAISKLGYKSVIEFYRDFDDLPTVAEKEMRILTVIFCAYILHLNQITPRGMIELSRALVLQAIDQYWMEHLDAMGNLREGIGMRSLAQKDPLVEYKNEGYILFERMIRSIDDAVVSRFFKVRVVNRERSLLDEAETVHTEIQNFKSARAAALMPSENQMPSTTSNREPIINNSMKIGRNDLCPCGSGKKYKKCHLDKDPQTDEEKAAFKLYVEDIDAWRQRYLK